MKRSSAVIAILMIWALAGSAAGAEEPKRPWTDAAEFALVSTSGNTTTTTFSLTNKYVYTWPNADVTVDANALRTETTTRILTNPAGTVIETEIEDTTAEIYALGGKYRHNITERFLWYGLGSWYRNKPAGIKDRYRVGAGVGYQFIKDDNDLLVGEVGLDYTDETQANVPEISDSFAGARGFLGYERKLSASAKFNGELEMLANLDESSDWRANALASVTASLTNKLALKASYRLAYDHEPVQQIIPGPIPAQDAVFTFDETDSILSIALVINF